MLQKISLKEPHQRILFVHRASGESEHVGSNFGVPVFMFLNPPIKTGEIFITNIDSSENPKLVAKFAKEMNLYLTHQKEIFKR